MPGPITGGGVNLHSPGPIGDVTPSTITGTTLTSTVALVVANGTSGAPSIFGSDSTTGFSMEPGGSGGIYFIVKGSAVMALFGTGQVSMSYIWSSTFGTTQCALSRASHGGDGFYFDAGTGAPGLAFGGNSILATSAGLVLFTVPITPLVTVVASLPAAATAGVGALAFVTDASTTVILGLGLTVVGGGSNKVPVYSDGAAWKIG